MIQGRAEFNGQAAARMVASGGSKILLAMATKLQVHLMNRLNVSNPKPYTTPSRAGEYLRKRTGFLQAHIVIEPRSLDDIAKQGRVRIGYGMSAFYGAIWENKPENQRRKGLLAALDEIKPELTRLGAMAG